MTLETRGFGIRGVRQTSYLEVVWRRSDTVVTILFTVFLVLALVLGCLSRTGLIALAIQWGGRA